MLFTLVLLASVVAAVLVQYWASHKSRYWSLLKQFPGDTPLPVVGNALTIGFDVDSVPRELMKMWRRHSMKNFRVTLGNQNWVVLTESSDIGILLSSPTELSKPDDRNAAIIPFFGNSLSTSVGERWRSTRKLVSPTFLYKTLDTRLDAVNNRIDVLLDLLSRNEGKSPVELYRYMRPFMYDLFCSTLIGVDSNVIQHPDCEVITESAKVSKILTTNYYSYWRNVGPLFRFMPDYYRMRRAIKIMQDNSTTLINQRRAILEKLIDNIRCNNQAPGVDVEQLIENKLNESSCFLDGLLTCKMQNGEPMPEYMINEELTLLTYTGHYTTAMTVTHTLYQIAKHSDVQRKLIDEQQTVFGKDFHRKPTSNDLSEMRYLDAVMKETMRMLPTLPKMGRKLLNDLQIKDGRVIPAGTSVVMYLDALFQNPNVYPEPEKFIPERFFEVMETFAFVPFSAGPRSCIGYRYAWIVMKATLSNILRRFEISEGIEPQFKHRFVMESENGVQLRFHRRS